MKQNLVERFKAYCVGCDMSAFSGSNAHEIYDAIIRANPDEEQAGEMAHQVWDYLHPEGIIYTVIENNGGGLSLYVFRGQQCIYSHEGYEFNYDQLSQDIAALDRGSDTSDWDGNMDDPQALWDEMEQFVTGYSTICTGGRGHHHIYPQAMGAAGKIEFYPALAEAIYIITNGADNREEAAETIDEIYCWLKNGDVHTDSAKELAAQWIEYISAE